MSLLILQNQGPQHSLAKDSYGVVATAAMLDQEVSVAYCGEGLKQLSDPDLKQALHNAIEFGIKKIYILSDKFNSAELADFVSNIELVTNAPLDQIIQAHDKVLSF